MKNGLWFLSTLSSTFLLGMFVYPNLNRYYFPCFHLHSFSSHIIYFQNALYSNLERLKISKRTFVQLKLGVPVWGIPLNRVLQNLELLDRQSQMDRIFGMG